MRTSVTVRAGEVPRGAGDGITVFFSVGLAGTEAFLLDRLASGARETWRPGARAT
jgi:hypothetical protein